MWGGRLAKGTAWCQGLLTASPLSGGHGCVCEKLPVGSAGISLAWRLPVSETVGPAWYLRWPQQGRRWSRRRSERAGMGKDGHRARWAWGRGHRLGEDPHFFLLSPRLLRLSTQAAWAVCNDRTVFPWGIRVGCPQQERLCPHLLAWDPLTPAPQFSCWPDPQTFSLSPLSLPVPIASFSSCKVSSHSVSYKGAVVLGVEGQRRRVELASPRAELRGCQPGHGALGICLCPQPRARWCWAWWWEL